MLSMTHVAEYDSVTMLSLLCYETEYGFYDVEFDSVMKLSMTVMTLSMNL